ncbi:thiolase family protein [Streptomyces bottropensis]|uniref:thiolase family protein n=1 Tax=Streptomyces bottropensis TaxID=42235 RepID=UPI0036C2DDF8
MTAVYVAGVGMTAFGVRLGTSVKDLTREAVAEALGDAGATQEHIEAAYFGNTCQDVLEGQNVIAGQVALRSMGFQSIPVVNVENACATAATALHQAALHIRSGAADIVLAVGVEKTNVEDRAKALALFEGGVDVHDPVGVRAILDELGGPVERSDSRPYSMFMEIYGALARAHMREFGTTAEQLALVASKNHAHAVDNPRAHFRKAMSVEEILGARSIVPPLTTPMCAPLTDGGAAAVLCSKAGLERLGASSRAVKVLASTLRTGSVRELTDWSTSVSRLAALQAYEQAGVGPDDVSVAEVHDAAAFGEILQSELLGFCAIGDGGTFAESGASTLGGRLPVNPSGGLESKGHPMGATGLAQVYELVQQLRGEAGSRQVPNARIAVAENGGGMYGGEEAVAAITILSA